MIVCGKRTLRCEAGNVISKFCTGQTTKKLAKMQFSSNQRKMVAGEAGNVISKLSTGQATKNGPVGCSAEPLRTHWDEEMAKNELWKRSMLGHIQTIK